MQVTILLNTNTEEEAEALIKKLYDASEKIKGASVQSFSTTLEAFAHVEAPFEVNEVITDEDCALKDLNDKSLFDAVAQDIEAELAKNLVDQEGEYGDVLDYPVIDEIVHDCFISVLKENLSRMDEHDKAITKQFIKDHEDGSCLV